MNQINLEPIMDGTERIDQAIDLAMELRQRELELIVEVKRLRRQLSKTVDLCQVIRIIQVQNTDHNDSMDHADEAWRSLNKIWKVELGEEG